jgi:signal peptidase II
MMRKPLFHRWRERWALVAMVVIADQLSKLAVLRWIAPNEKVRLLPGLALTHLYNEGAAFSFLHDAGGWQRYFFIALTFAICTYLIYWLRQLSPKQSWLALGIVLVLGGAVGNLIDRILYGHVIDFILLYAGERSFPVFNIADSAISVGAAVIFLLILLSAEARKEV